VLSGIITDAATAGFYQAVIRSTHAYDESSKNIIAGDYARQTYAYHGLTQERVQHEILSAVDQLWAGP
jgi:hypothetical protein